jgi:hypothetical protein
MVRSLTRRNTGGTFSTHKMGVLRWVVHDDPSGKGNQFGLAVQGQGSAPVASTLTSGCSPMSSPYGWSALTRVPLRSPQLATPSVCAIRPAFTPHTPSEGAWVTSPLVLELRSVEGTEVEWSPTSPRALFG